MRLRAAAYYKKPYYLKGHRSKDGDNGTLEGLAASAGAAAPAPAATGAAAPAVAASVPVPAASASSDAVATPSASAAAGTEVNARTSALRAYARALTGTNTASAAVAVPSTVQVVAPTPTPQATAQTTPQPPKDPAGGLVAYWTFDAPDVTRFSDASGMGHVAHKVGGGRLQPGKQGMALLLDSTAYLKATNNQWLNAKEAVTVALWVRPDAAGDFGIVTNLRADGTGGGYRLALRRERAEFEVRADPKRARSTGEVAGGVQLQSGLWYHVAGVYSARDGLLRTYVNGRLDRQVEAPPTSFAPSAATELLIGCEADGQGRWVGCLDDLRLYNRALSVEEIAVLARANAATTVLAPASR